MNDLISRQAAIDAVKKNTFRLTFAEEQNCEGHLAWSANAVYSDVIEGALLELPSAQPERKKGKWHQRFYSKVEMMVCSECGNEFSYDAETGLRDYNFCPNCGADMREDEQE